MRTLTIAIPTYNRSEKLNNQIFFLFESISNNNYPIEIIICDNCSEDNTSEICQYWNSKFINNNLLFRYFRNVKNLGLVGNVIKCFENTTTELVWIIGDDDDINKSSLLNLLEIIKYEVKSYSIYHLNYVVMDGRNNEKIKDYFYSDKIRKAENVNFEDCLKENLKVDAFMFITANIVSKEIAIEAISLWKRGSAFLAYPLYIYLYASIKGPFKFIDFAVFKGYYHVGSWKKYVNIVMRIEIPLVIIRLYTLKLIKMNLAFKLISNYTSFMKILKELIKKPSIVYRIFNQLN